jgi:DNA-binding MarR family transcriptional regulator
VTDDLDRSLDAPDLTQLDMPVIVMLSGWAVTDEIQRRLDADGFDDTRSADGVIFQYLIPDSKKIGELAELLGVSQQAVSKAVADLERRGYVVRERDPDDARARRVKLTSRGEAAIAAGRRHRAELDDELAERFGSRRLTAARGVLTELLEQLGAEVVVRRRRVRPPR